MAFKKMTVVLAGLVALALILVACERPAKPMRSESDRKAAPEFTLKDADGRVAKLSEYRGKVVLLNFWATWCGPCKVEIPWFIEFEQSHKDKGFAVLGVSMDEEGWDAVKPYIANRRVNYRVVLGDDSTAQVFGGVDSLPTTFMIDRQGRIASTHIGLISKNAYQNEILQLLEDDTSGARIDLPGVPACALRAK